MSNRSIKTFIVIVFIATVIACNKREEAIAGQKYGNITVSAFTVDSLLFSVKLNNDLLVDSLASPVASVTRKYTFNDTVAHLQVYEKNNFNRIVIDTNIYLKIGYNYIDIVQLNSDEKPHMPVPPNEPLPAPGFCKVRLVYTAPQGSPFADSLKFGVVPYGDSKTKDSAVLSRDEYSERYVEVKKGENSFQLRVYNPVNNAFIRETEFVGTNSYKDFNTVNVKAVKVRIGNTDVVGYSLARVY